MFSKKKDETFYRELLKYSESDLQEELHKEWKILFKHKGEKYCICGHTIHHYAHVYNILNGHIINIGVGCCKKYGLTNVATNLILLEFLSETEEGSLVLQNGLFDINRDLDFIKFINENINENWKIEKENMEFHIRKLEIWKKNLEELVDVYHFYCGSTIIEKINGILSNLNFEFDFESDKEPIVQLIHNIESVAREPIVEVVEKVENKNKKNNENEEINSATIHFIMQNIIIQIENNPDNLPTKYTFHNHSLNELCKRADESLTKLKLITQEVKYNNICTDIYINKINNRLLK